MIENRKNGKPLRIVFIGAVEEGRECLQEILDWGGEVVGIFTFTRALAESTSGAVPFDGIADAYSIPLFRVKSTNTPEVVEQIRSLQPDVVFVIGWTRLVSSEILAIPRFGCVGMHASLLPKYRGRAPVNWVLIHNEVESGNTAMKLNDGADTGEIAAQRAFPISLADTCQTLYHKVSLAGREMTREILDHISEGQLPLRRQDDSQATEMARRRPEDGVIDWGKGALPLFNWVRALTHPYPGAYSFFRGEKLTVWEARIAHYPYLNIQIHKWRQIVPGTIMAVSDGLVILTGGMELLSLHRVQLEGDAEINWRTFVKRYQIAAGEILADSVETTEAAS